MSARPKIVARGPERYTEASMVQLVQAAEPIAREYLLGAIDRLWTATQEEGDVCAAVSELLELDAVGDDHDYWPHDEPALSHALLALRAACAIGIAIGAQLPRELFAREPRALDRPGRRQFVVRAVDSRGV